MSVFMVACMCLFETRDASTALALAGAPRAVARAPPQVSLPGRRS